MDKYLKGVNPQKMAKIEEAAKEIKPSKYDRPENWKPPAPKKPKVEKADEDMDMIEKPKKAPPKGLGQKPPPKKKPADEDAEMADEMPPPKAPAAKKPPVLSSDRPKTAAVSSTKGPVAPVIQDEDLGHGCSKEEAIERVTENFSAGTIAKFEDAKWNIKCEGFTELQDEIKEKEPSPEILEAVAKFVKAKMKDWKESNINLQKAIVAIFNFIATNCERINKRTISCGMSFFVDKIGDVKLSNSIKEMLMNMSELVTPKFIALQTIKYAATAKAPNNIKDSCELLSSISDEFGISGIPLKETIDFAKVAAAHATPNVRQAAMKLFCEIYKHAGDVIRNFMADIKESTLKMIDAELNKIEQYKKGEHQRKRTVRGEAAEEEQAAAPGKKGKGGGGGGDLFDLPREDISKKLTSKLME
jgi:cytoskeleton-associated protein 5